MRIKSLLPFLIAPCILQAELDFKPDETVLVEGNSLMERILEDGTFQAYLHLARPELRLKIRSLAWTGDEVGYRLRPEGYTEHLKSLLQTWPARTVLLGYGMNESFAGPSGLEEFRSQLQVLLRETRRLHPEAQIILVSPIAVEDGGPSDAAARNRDIALYSKSIQETASENGALFVDLFKASRDAYARKTGPLTQLGIHPNEAGCRLLARTLASALVGEQPLKSIAPERLTDLAQATQQEARCNADLVRPKNAVVYFGVRKRPEEYAAEIPRYHQLLNLATGVVHDLAKNPNHRFKDAPPLSLPAMPEGLSKTDRHGGGIIKPPTEQIQEFKVADGYALNLFASEAEFPDLRNPVHMAFDARGRLWVATMPSFPHTIPGSPREDKILILEDTDRDGKADRSTVFLDQLDAVDGIAFHPKGVLISAQPRILLAQDSNGDGKADHVEEVLRGVDVTDSHHGGMIAVDPIGQLLFCDGVFHRSQFETPFGVVRGIDSTTYRLDPFSGRVQTEFQALTPNPWRISFDRYGNLYQRYGGGHVLDALPLTWTPLGIYHPYGHSTVLDYNKGCALEVISSPNFPPEYQQGFASATLLGSYFVSLSRSSYDKGPVVAQDRLDILSNPNAAFRPVDVTFGFDGALYVADFCSRIIGHAQHPMRDPQWDHSHGRIWRVLRKDGPISKDWPEIEKASQEQLLSLLAHPQDLVRQHARIRLQSMDCVPALQRWIHDFDRTQSAFPQAALEALWVAHARGSQIPGLLSEIAHAKDPMVRVAAARLLRFQAPSLPDAQNLLTSLARDPHPRVRMAVIHAVAFLRQTDAGFEKALEPMLSAPQPEPVVAQMLGDLRHGQKPARARSIPVLEIHPDTLLKHWQLVSEKNEAPSAGKPGKPQAERTFRSFVSSERPQDAVLSIRHGFLDVFLNGVQLLSADSNWSTDQQVQLQLPKGLSQIQIVVRKSKSNQAPPASLFDPTGALLVGARIPTDDSLLRTLAAEWDQAHPVDDSTLKIQAVPNLLQFTPRELTVTAGKPVRIVFENPDLMLHNLVLVASGADEQVGTLADAMAVQPDALEKNYVPASPLVLKATPLVKPNEKAELHFTAPETPGVYPLLCTFPGHWRVMRANLVVRKP
jgi:azurin